MSIIFGMRKPTGTPVTVEQLLRMARTTERYAPDGVLISAFGKVGMGFQPYHTHQRSRLEHGAVSDAHRNLLVFDGRLDNYRELSHELGISDESIPDSHLVLAAFQRWGEGCFSRLHGDWAIVLWSAREQLLYLARDHAGTRTLYFENKNGTLTWSTHLEGFFTDDRSLEAIDEAYAACYLAVQPVRDLTPYKGIRAVLPAHYVIVRNDGHLITKPHWQWMNTKRLRYSSDEEYDEHFLTLFRQAVERRTGPGAPMLAQLSGGMDSSSIVCMSDLIRRSQDPSAEILDTISFYDDAEPSWNEKPYFTAVEAQRGKTGTHVKTSFSEKTFEPHDPAQGLYLLPGADSSTLERERRLHSEIGEKGYRVILSGIGGDEVLGGVPTPTPELANYLVEKEFALLLKQTLAWCLTDRTPFFHMLFGVAKETAKLYGHPQMRTKSTPPWLQPPLQRACVDFAQTGPTSASRRGLAPSNIYNGLAWWSIMETLPHLYPGLLARPEYRYPYLDRQLVEYASSIPREQLVRPGRRRFLMRRALKNIVPEAILERRRKAYRIRGPLAAMQQARSKINLIFTDPLILDQGFIDPAHLQVALDLTCKGHDTRWWQALARAIELELWLRANRQRYGMDCTVSLGYQISLPNTGANTLLAERLAD